MLGATVIRSFNSTGMGAKVPGTDTYCYRERKFQGTKVPGSESSRERKYEGEKVPPMVLLLLGAKVCGNESSIIHSVLMTVL